MKRKLWTFGDSFTDRFTNTGWSEKYVEWKGYAPKVYGEIIADKLDLELINLGKAGSDNYTIFQTICDVSNSVKSDDMIIIGWSSPLRYRLVNMYNRWWPIIPHSDTTMITFENVSKNTMNEIAVNRAHNLYVYEVNSWIKLLNYTFLKNNIIHWSPFEGMVQNFFGGIESIKTETGGELDDSHYSEKGQQMLSDTLLLMLSQNINKKLINVKLI
jgi:hypothetical protein